MERDLRLWEDDFISRGTVSNFGIIDISKPVMYEYFRHFVDSADRMWDACTAWTARAQGRRDTTRQSLPPCGKPWMEPEKF